MRTAAAWCLLLPSAAAFAPAPPPDSRRRALTTRSAGAGELLAEVRDLARLRPTRDDIVRLSDACDAGDGALRFLRRRKRYGLLAELLKRDAAAYADVAGWLYGACGVWRDQLPNLERVPLAAAPPPAVDDLVPDCTLTNKTFAETPLDAFLLQFTRDRYAEHTPGPAFRSRQAGILGLLEEMRVLMLDERGTDAAQQDLVIRVLLDLMTPALPPFYRLFMGGLVPSAERATPRGSWTSRRGSRCAARAALARRARPPYAPLLTSVVAPFVFGFLVGPGRVNRRGDGARGGRRGQVQVPCRVELQGPVPAPVQAAGGALGRPGRAAARRAELRDAGVPVVLGRRRAGARGRRRVARQLPRRLREPEAPTGGRPKGVLALP